MIMILSAKDHRNHNKQAIIGPLIYLKKSLVIKSCMLVSRRGRHLRLIFPVEVLEIDNQALSSTT
jgi:hypothetical protein